MGYCNHQSLLTIAICFFVFINLVSSQYPERFSLETDELPIRGSHFLYHPHPYFYHAPAPAPGGNNGGVSVICNACDDPDLCLETVTPYLKGKPDIKSVLAASLKGASDFAMLVKAYTHSQGAPVEARDSARIYSNVVFYLQKANEALLAYDIEKMNSMLMAVHRGVDDSGSKVAKAAPTSRIAQYSATMSSMANNCLAISFQLHK